MTRRNTCLRWISCLAQSMHQTKHTFLVSFLLPCATIVIPYRLTTTNWNLINTYFTLTQIGQDSSMISNPRDMFAQVLHLTCNKMQIKNIISNCINTLLKTAFTLKNSLVQNSMPTLTLTLAYRMSLRTVNTGLAAGVVTN
jgi:hypothetical protein